MFFYKKITKKTIRKLLSNSIQIQRVTLAYVFCFGIITIKPLKRHLHHRKLSSKVEAVVKTIQKTHYYNIPLYQDAKRFSFTNKVLHKRLRKTYLRGEPVLCTIRKTCNARLWITK